MIEPTPSSEPQTRLSRRSFLAGAAAAAAGLAASRAGPTLGAPTSQSAPPATTQPKPRPLVVRAHSEFVVEGRIVQQSILRDMLERCLTALTGESTLKEAWRRLIDPSGVVGLKFNQSGAAGLGTSAAFAETLVSSLIDAGWSPERIVPIEIPRIYNEYWGTTPPTRAWKDEVVDFGSGKDELSAVLDQVDALVNVPFLKTHNIAGVTCCMKNLSHALVKHPARFHANGCSPYIADILALPQIREKTKLCIVNALRSVFDGGPEAHVGKSWKSGLVLAGTDPVAVDTVGLDILNRQRKSRGLPYLDEGTATLPYLEAAAERGLGCCKFHEIELERYKL